MSFWTHVSGVVEVNVYGSTQPQIEYILNTVLEHLPRITGSEGDVHVHPIKQHGHNCCSTHDEFEMRTNNATTEYGEKSRRYGMYYMQQQYSLVLEGSLRDRMFDTTKTELLKWLCRLSKRLHVDTVVVKLWDDYDRELVISNPDPFEDMYEWRDDEIRWTDYLRWECAPNTSIPMKLYAKYFSDEEVEEELVRREQWAERLENSP